MSAEEEKKKTRWRSLLFGFFLVLLPPALTGIVPLAGCSGGLSGGSVPLPNQGVRQTRLVGTVVDGNDPSVPLANAVITIVTPQGQIVTAQTDTLGQFRVHVPRGGLYWLTIRPPQEVVGLLQSDEIEIEVEEDEVHLVIPLYRRDLILPTIQTARIDPQSVRLKVREKVTFRLLLEPGAVVLITPIWTVHGGIGLINPDGTFVATRAGSGRVEARLRRLRAVAWVEVEE
ncbi:MAG: carboxypeptidase-like regulatory domain-containing protein [Armatimonadetes bacterium]|nr:carboxypeptidase-like regulatory domain-containing protein [Armatimonadota bacterium]MDW8122685.1 carboxypeptidase-like regulatory domain-containing protein [Armatimonadota bacterium]